MTRTAALLRWLREEVRLAGLASWSDGAYHGPPDPQPCSASDPRCAALIERQADARARMIASRIVPIERRRDVKSAAATDIAATFDAIRRVSAPPVRLIGRRAK